MSRERDFVDYLRDMLDTIYAVVQFVPDMDYVQFTADLKTQFAVTRGLEIIGEAAKHIPPSVREKYPEIEWRDVVGMRDWLAHGYFATDLDIVWQAVQRDLPRLKPVIEQMLADATAVDQDHDG